MSEIQQGLSLSVVGVVAVFTALIVIALMVIIISRFTQDKPPIPAVEAAPLPDVSYVGGVDKHVLVLLAAAATVAVKRPVRIRRVRFVTHQHVSATWAAAGRTEHAQESL
uniref:Oxaloacetate decarboxylase, gamma chain n=1 Tax=Candidatus Kentrum sp. MB TaxID=2138164 RepID=A0A451BDH5_9GAMM|nr:MAG: hypothetical protein BECKMB1821G_GA0114241_105015 [Candidatus Kentron sp. MB]VFK33647.1 MAG: hypothetical protein BECKMB1821I_GA0114274_105013 [Candidatus Kentron sp. MB]VFK76344.1 MAG: hypothetical protein BECKMB1821H_GA0114242_105213 [Candidatus Kentron sp. MB]